MEEEFELIGPALITLMDLWAGLVRSLFEDGARATFSASSKESFLGLVSVDLEIDVEDVASLRFTEFNATETTEREASF